MQFFLSILLQVEFNGVRSLAELISVDSDPRRGIQPGPPPTNLCVLMSQSAAAAAPQGPTFGTLATHGYLWANQWQVARHRLALADAANYRAPSWIPLRGSERLWARFIKAGQPAS